MDAEGIKPDPDGMEEELDLSGDSVMTQKVKRRRRDLRRPLTPFPKSDPQGKKSPPWIGLGLVCFC